MERQTKYIEKVRRLLLPIAMALLVVAVVWREYRILSGVTGFCVLLLALIIDSIANRGTKFDPQRAKRVVDALPDVSLCDDGIVCSDGSGWPRRVDKAAVPRGQYAVEVHSAVAGTARLISKVRLTRAGHEKPAEVSESCVTVPVDTGVMLIGCVSCALRDLAKEDVMRAVQAVAEADFPVAPVHAKDGAVIGMVVGTWLGDDIYDVRISQGPNGYCEIKVDFEKANELD